MKTTLTVLFSLLCLIAYADPDEIVLNNPNQQHDHNEYYDPADKPEVYYNSGNQEIILVADGFASYYDVDIISLSTLSLVLYQRVSGYGDNIDVSSLPDDNYKIVISTSYNNVYEGYFTNY